MTRSCARWLAGIALIVGLMLSGRASWAWESASGYPAIQSAFLREDFELTASLARTFLTQHPDMPEVPRVWLWLAFSLDRLQRSNEALQELDRLKGRLDPADALWPEVLFWEGDISRRALQLIRARLAYQRLLDQYPDSTWTSQARVGLGMVYFHQQAFESALGYFREAGKSVSGPAALDAKLFQGLCHLRLEQSREAVAVFKSLLGELQEPAVTSQVLFYLGEGYSGLKQYGEAERAYRSAISASPKSSWARLAHFGLGWIFYQTDHCEESVQAFERYRAFGMSDHQMEALFAQGSCLLRLEREREALSRFEEALSRDPGHPLALESGLIVADAYQRQEQFKLAKDLLHQLLRRQTEATARTKLQLRLGGLALDQGNAAQAKTVFELARHTEETALQQAALVGLGDVQVLLGDPSGARPLYEEAVRLSEGPTAAYATYQLGRIQLQAGAFDEAIGIFQRLLMSGDRTVADDARIGLAVAYLNQQETMVARSLLDTIRQQRPDSVVAARSAYYEALLALGDEDELAAQRFCQEVLAKAPRTEEALEARLLLADIRASRTSVREAIAWLQEAYASGTLPLRHRSRLAKRLGDLARSDRAYAEAIRWYDESMQLFPSPGGEAVYRMASCYEEAGDLEVAMRWYRQVDQSPWRIRSKLALAKLLERQGEVEEAQALYLSLAGERAPEAKVAQERLTTRQGGTINKE